MIKKREIPEIFLCPFLIWTWAWICKYPYSNYLHTYIPHRIIINLPMKQSLSQYLITKWFCHYLKLLYKVFLWEPPSNWGNSKSYRVPSTAWWQGLNGWWQHLYNLLSTEKLSWCLLRLSPRCGPVFMVLESKIIWMIPR